MIKKQKFNLPDGKGGKDTYYFETLAEKVEIDDKPLDEYLENNFAEVKRDYTPRPVITPLTISTNGWQLNSSEISEYKYFYEVEVENLTAKDIVEVFYSRGSIDTVLESGVCPCDTEKLEGKFRIWAIEIPTKDISASYVVWKG